MLYLVITGISSGLGEAIAEVASQTPDVSIIGVSRRGSNPGLQHRASSRESHYLDYRFDLAESARIGAFSVELFALLEDGADNHLILVNNAAVEGPLGRLGSIDSAGLIDHIAVNLTACMLLAGEFIHYTEGWTARRTIVNITSGAAQHPYDGMSAYCASKAGLDMFGRCVALEQKDASNPVRVVAIAPGVLATQMQDRIRAVPDEAFPSKGRFVALEREGKLASPMDAARRILSLVQDDSFENGAVLDLRNLP